MPSDLDRAFELIEKGHAQEKNGNQWESADCFGQAMLILEKLAADSHDNTQEEQAKIVQLYRNKSREYRQEARECLIKALQSEKQEDTESEKEPIALLISEEEAQRRLRTFQVLFSKPIEEKDVSEKTSALEARLMELNSSLPSGFKTSSERMADINRGLNRLGLSLYSNSDHKSDSVQVDLSHEEQVAEIIAQAKEEVQYEAGKEEPAAATTSDSSNAFLVGASDSEDDEDSFDSEDSDSESILKNKKAIRRKVVKAQVKLAELMALLDNTTAGRTVNKESDDESNEDSEQNAGFDLEYGRSTLAAATNYLNKAMKEWSENA